MAAVTPDDRYGRGMVVSVIVLATVGLAGLGLQPVLVSALLEASKMNVHDAGYIASAEVFGIALTNTLSAFAGARISWRKLCLTGLILTFVGNVASIAVGTAFTPLLMARFTAGLGEGLLISKAYGAASLTRDPDRIVGWILASSTAHIAIGSLLLPRLAVRYGVNLIFWYFAALVLLGCAFTKSIPIGGTEASRLLSRSSSSILERAAALSSAAFLFFGLGVLWAYLFQIGLSMGATIDGASIGLALSQVAAFVGALLASFTSRWARSVHIMTLLLTGACIVLIPLLSGGAAYAIVASGFNGASNAAMVIALGTIAALETDGRWMAAGVTSQTLGFALGPALAAQVVGNSDYRMAEFLSIGILVCSLVATLITQRFARQRTRGCRVPSHPSPVPNHT